jgi:hypothetical protein
MSKAIRGLLIAAGAWFICVSGAWGQAELISPGWLVGNDPNPRVIPIQKRGDSTWVYIRNMERSSLIFRDSYFYWMESCGLYLSNSYYYELDFTISRTGNPILFKGDQYDYYSDSLYYCNDYYPVDRACPGRPVIDNHDNIHIIWQNQGDTAHLYYAYTTDSLNTFAVLDTLLSMPPFLHLVKSPNDSIVGALFYSWQTRLLSKYLAADGQPIDFTSPAETLRCNQGVGSYDLTLGNDGKAYSVASVHDGYSMSGWHYAWSEDHGYSYIDAFTDEVNDTPAFEFAFGPNEGEILLIEDGWPPNGSGSAGYFVTTDGGNSWYRSAYRQPFNNAAFYASTPRTYADTIEIVYYTTHPSSNVYYLPIPRDSIFSQLVSIEGEAAPIPDNISLSNYPNPFNASTTINFNLPKAGQVRLAIYDIAGREIKQLVEGDYEVGPYSIIWNGQNNDGQIVSSGIYFYQLSINGNRSATKEMILLK